VPTISRRRERDGRGDFAFEGSGAHARAHVVIIGAGFGGLSAAKALGGQGLQITVVDRLNYHLFQPLLYQVALAGLAATDIAYPIRSALHRQRDTRVLLGEVARMDLAARTVRLTDGAILPYDYVIVATGARTSYFGHDAWRPFAPGIKDLDDALEMRRRVLFAFEAAERAATDEERRRWQTFAIVGGGPTGVELAGAIADLSRDILREDFRRLHPEQTRVVIFEMADRILTPFVPSLSKSAARQLEDLGVEVRTGVRVENIDAEGLWLSGELLRAGTILWGAGVEPSPLARTLGVPVDRAGRVIVGPDCGVPGHPEAFVIGDSASLTPPGATEPLPGISPVAIQEGRAVARNILRAHAGEPPAPFRYVDKGFMATIGRARAVATLGKLRLTGFVAWLAWVFVHLWYLVGFRNRIAVFINWIWAYLMSNHGARVIIGAVRAPQAAPRVPGPAAAAREQSPPPPL
jgi:NADH:quinone reductase (non-electrogenic)